MRARVIATVALALFVAGCGGDDEEPAAQSPSTAPKTVDAAMKGFEFTPAEIEVAAGGTVTWTDEDSSNHNVQFKTPGAPTGFNNLREGKSASVTFDKPGTYAFVCTFHPNMKGTVDVR